MKKFLSLIAAGIFLIVSFGAIAQQPGADEIIRKMDRAMRGKSSHAKITMTIERPRYSREVSMEAWQLGGDYSLIRITAPARDQGTTYLKRENEIWNYVPRIDRTIKLPPSMMSQSWMGSDFTNDDLVRETSTVEDYNHSLLREESVNGREAWVVEMIPKPDAAVVWGKLLVWVDKQEFIQLKAEYYDQNDELVNTLTLDQIRDIGDRIFPTRMTMIPADKSGHRTILTYQTIEFNIDLEPSFFTKQNMTRLR